MELLRQLKWPMIFCKTIISGYCIQFIQGILLFGFLAIPGSMDSQSTTSEIKSILSRIEKNMVFVKGGSFEMGCDRGNFTERRHPVELSDFRINKFEVTQAEWEAVTGMSILDQSRVGNFHRPIRGAGPQYPMYNVSWEAVQVFIRKLNEMTGGSYRLPTEAEWEYAARGGSYSQGYRFSGSNDLNEVGWFGEDFSTGSSHPVGSKGKANELGLFDMSGNVLEWCSDLYGPYVSGKNPKGAPYGRSRVSRGGSWLSSELGCKVCDRYCDVPYVHFVNVGFRLASDVPENASSSPF